MPPGPRYTANGHSSPAQSPSVLRDSGSQAQNTATGTTSQGIPMTLGVPSGQDTSVSSSQDDDVDGNSVIDVIMAKADSLASKLRLEEQARIKAENEVRKLSGKLKTLQSRYERTADRLDKMMSQSRGFVSVTDEELKTKAERLRHSIRNFAIEYFTGPRQHHSSEPHAHRRRSRRIELIKESYDTFMPHHYELYFYKPDGGPMVVQNFLWTVLKFKVFDRFRWAESVSNCLNEFWYRLAISEFIARTTIRLDQILISLRYLEKAPGSHKSPETIRKSQMWRASTTDLVLDHLGGAEMSGHTEKKREELIDDIRKVLDPFSSSHDDAYNGALSNILDAAVNLDKTISTQVARIYWAFREKTDREHHAEEHHRAHNEKGIVVVCPAMLKRGKSNGEEFDVETVLLPRIEAMCKLD